MLLDILFPKHCIECKKIGQYICNTCIKQIVKHNQTCIVCTKFSPLGKTHSHCQKHTSLDGVISPTEYKNLTRTALHQIKYKLNYHIIDELLTKTIISDKIQNCIDNEAFNICCEIPMHKFKENKRGFNQSKLIAQWINKKYKIPYQSLIKKTRQTTPQMNLKREERIFNLINAFQIKGNISVYGKNILLVDDVTTTASTLEECAVALKKHSANKVWALVISSRKYSINH